MADSQDHRLLFNQIIRDLVRTLHLAHAAGTRCRFSDLRNHLRTLPAFRVARTRISDADKLLGMAWAAVRKAGWVRTYEGLTLSLSPEGVRSAQEIWDSFTRIQQELYGDHRMEDYSL